MIRTTVHRLAVGAVSLLLAAACDGGGTRDVVLLPPAADLTGAWTMKEMVYQSCQGPSFPQSSTYAVAVTQTGNSVTLHDGISGNTYQGTISGDSVSWSFSYPSGGATISGTFSGTVQAGGNVVVGSANWTATGATACSGRTDVNAARNGWTPAAPTGLTARAGYRQVTLSWTAVEGAAEYDVYRSTVPNAAVYGSLVYTTSAILTSTTIRWLTNETTSYYAIKAVTAADAGSSASNEVVATPSATYPRPPTPANVVATAGTGQIFLSWDPVPEATKYRIFKASTPGQIPTYDSTQHFSSLTTTRYTSVPWPVSAGSTAYFVVTAWNLDGESEPSAEVSATAL